GTVAASASSVPNEPLYGVKRKAEAVRLLFSLGDDTKASLYADLVDRRLVEMASMTEAGRPREVELLGQDLQGHLERIKALAGGGGQAQGEPRKPQLSSRGDQGPKAKPPLPPGPAVSPAPGASPGDGALARRAEVLAAMLERSIERRRRQLELALANAPPELRPRIKQAIAQSEEQHKRALEEMKRRASEAGREKREGTPPREEQRRERPPEPKKPREGTPRSLNTPPAQGADAPWGQRPPGRHGLR
ncbi:MAG: hypothetical protein HY330_05045, partial [Chloroflexi bacterium]|nr:hypothetical protein [Chloroflexota bacterium]